MIIMLTNLIKYGKIDVVKTTLEDNMTERFDEFTSLITNIYRNIKKIRNDEMAEYNLKSMHLSCLHYMYKYQKLTAAQLCDIALEDKANVSRCLRYLQDEGYIAPNENIPRKYQCFFRLTKKGMSVALGIEEKIKNILNITGRDLKAEDREIMYSSLRSINDNLSKISDSYNDEKGKNYE